MALMKRSDSPGCSSNFIFIYFPKVNICYDQKSLSAMKNNIVIEDIFEIFGWLLKYRRFVEFVFRTILSKRIGHDSLLVTPGDM